MAHVTLYFCRTCKRPAKKPKPNKLKFNRLFDGNKRKISLKYSKLDTVGVTAKYYLMAERISTC